MKKTFFAGLCIMKFYYKRQKMSGMGIPHPFSKIGLFKKEYMSKNLCGSNTYPPRGHFTWPP